jgi:hypothetical protein
MDVNQGSDGLVHFNVSSVEPPSCNLPNGISFTGFPYKDVIETDVEGASLTIEKSDMFLSTSISWKNKAQPQCAWKKSGSEMQFGFSIILGALAVGVAWF